MAPSSHLVTGRITMKPHVNFAAMILGGIAATSIAVQTPSTAASASHAVQAAANQKVRIVSGPAANRIVGTYQNDGQVRKCGTNFPYMPIGGTITFHAGGTVTESARFPPSGAPKAMGVPGLNTRTIGLGTWWYNPFTRSYSMSMRFDWFVEGAFNGTNTVDRDIYLSPDGNTLSGPVEAIRYAVDGSVIVDLCGSAKSTRL
jgi:hypothetical protein